MLFRCLSNDGVGLLLDIPVDRKPEALSPVLNAGRCGEVAVYGQGRAFRPSHTSWKADAKAFAWLRRHSSL